MITEILVFVLTTLVSFVLYTYKKNHWYFESRDVKFLPGLPIFGNNFSSLIGRRHFFDDVKEVYSSFPGERYVGYIEGINPVLMIRDPELIKAITVKDFDHFVDHRAIFADPILKESLIQLKGDKWRDMRTTLSPAFTGSKMKHMVPFMNDISNHIVQYLKENEGEDIDVDDCVRRFTNDVIASTAFGLEVNSLKDKENKFYKTGQSMVVFSGWTRAKLFLSFMMPVFGKIMTIFPPEVSNFFHNIVTRTMDHREKNKVERPDMIQILMEASKGTLKSSSSAADKNVGFAATEEADIKTSRETRYWTHDELVAQAFLFFLGGFDSIATVLALAVHQITLLPKVQDKLYAEVKAFHDKHKGINYEHIHELKYLDAVVNETLRLWSPAVFLDRICQKDYSLPPAHEGGKPYLIKKGDLVYNMVTGLHSDPQYFPNPHIFDPERFSDKNKHEIKPFTFMPFGSGPRNCIASRYALMELKVFLYHLVLNFNLEKCSKTMESIKLKPSAVNIRVQGGSWVKTASRR